MRKKKDPGGPKTCGSGTGSGSPTLFPSLETIFKYVNSLVSIRDHFDPSSQMEKIRILDPGSGNDMDPQHQFTYLNLAEYYQNKK
jgi:hypothetical protein